MTPPPKTGAFVPAGVPGAIWHEAVGSLLRGDWQPYAPPSTAIPLGNIWVLITALTDKCPTNVVWSLCWRG